MVSMVASMTMNDQPPYGRMNLRSEGEKRD
jgi:hypothetical protein